ncbi:uncharacterized protein AMSG_06678 [Thecamonas trahens ATCC 50062]|uniref:Uncharacterized protein n=1 Tax=Thecamonas trahens ATCC 50062 TaxID=461836 RepID=A0A0L0DF62_THETB|nr:hypothetical protein AMSG_06678 [Thecamonas trahens ATCC 50062]KNC50781.1 hypothetical protein AMSG_06678 [Thecamonas trahens ATCC 50062]|eukprot:XP_013756740.1 hypothetical protein AMSG_06678 [Thecamonas trahens ATCC 50062]
MSRGRGGVPRLSEAAVQAAAQRRMQVQQAKKRRAAITKNRARRMVLYRFDTKQLEPHIGDLRRCVATYLAAVKARVEAGTEARTEAGTEAGTEASPTGLDMGMDVVGGGMDARLGGLGSQSGEGKGEETDDARSRILSLRFGLFKETWRTLQMSYIHHGRPNALPNEDFIDGLFSYILPYFVLPHHPLHTRITMLYLMYLLYATQNELDACRIKVTLPIFAAIRKLAVSASALGLDDPFHVFRSLWLTRDAFSFHAVLALGEVEEVARAVAVAPGAAPPRPLQTADTLMNVFDPSGVEDAHSRYQSAKRTAGCSLSDPTLSMIDDDLPLATHDALDDLAVARNQASNTRALSAFEAASSSIQARGSSSAGSASRQRRRAAPTSVVLPPSAGGSRSGTPRLRSGAQTPSMPNTPRAAVVTADTLQLRAPASGE